MKFLSFYSLSLKNIYVNSYFFSIRKTLLNKKIRTSTKNFFEHKIVTKCLKTHITIMHKIYIILKP